MSVLGLIVEYNPFHNGHLYHLEKAKKMTNAEITIAVMSGAFVQRGEPALLDKWTRANMALLNGVDLVIELPVIYATQAADWFSFGAVSLLDRLNVDYLVFGSESNSLSKLHDLASLLETEDFSFQTEMKKNLSLGHSYPKALGLSLQQAQPMQDDFFLHPNDILGLQYILQIKKMNAKFQPLTIKRKSSSYHDQNLTDQQIASATAIRNSVHSTSDEKLPQLPSTMPKSSWELLNDARNQGRIQKWDNFYLTTQILLLNQSIDQLSNIHGMSEGLESRFKQSVQASSFSDFITSTKTKRYTQSKLQRQLIHLLLNLTKEYVHELDVKSGPQYLRVLGFNQKGRTYLNQLKHQKTSVPIITKISREKPSMLELDILASQIYEAGFLNPAYRIDEYQQIPIIVK